MSLNIYQGDKTDIINITVEDETDYSDYSCIVKVVGASSGTEYLTKNGVVNATDGVAVFLTHAETLTLSPMSYQMFIRVEKTENSVITYSKEIHESLIVEASGF